MIGKKLLDLLGLLEGISGLVAMLGNILSLVLLILAHRHSHADSWYRCYLNEFKALQSVKLC